MLDGYSAMSKASVLRHLGIEWNGERPRVYLTDEEHAFARTLLAQAGLQPEQRLITLDPTHRQPTRRWPLAHYAGLVSLLAERDASLRFLPLWGPGEEAEIQELSRLCPAGSLLLPERMLSLREMAACIAEADLHIGNCSAPRHIAVAVGTPDPHRTRFDHTGVDLPLPRARRHCPEPSLSALQPQPLPRSPLSHRDAARPGRGQGDGDVEEIREPGRGRGAFFKRLPFPSPTPSPSPRKLWLVGRPRGRSSVVAQGG